LRPRCAPIDQVGAVAEPTPAASDVAPPERGGATPTQGLALLTRPGRAPGGPRVVVLGDSVAWSLASYVPPEPRMWLINGAIQGCGIARLPDIRYLGHAAHELPGLHALGQPMARHRRAIRPRCRRDHARPVGALLTLAGAG